MNELSEYNEAILDNIDSLMREMQLMLNNFITIWDPLASDLDALSESINTCNNSTCAEELEETLNLWESNVTATYNATNVNELENKILNFDLDNEYNAKIEQLKKKAIDCLSL